MNGYEQQHSMSTTSSCEQPSHIFQTRSFCVSKPGCISRMRHFQLLPPTRWQMPGAVLRSMNSCALCPPKHGRRKDFFQGRATRGFFPGGAKSGEICFLPLEIEKTTRFSEIFKIHVFLD